MITVKNLIKKYAGKEVLNIDYLNIPSGNIYGIIGPSGAGKSTFLRIINGLEVPTEGRIYFKGIEVKYPLNLAIRRQMTMVSQKPVLFSTSVYNNVYYGLKLRGENRRDSRKKVLEAIERVGLKGMENRNAKFLSGGEAQRIALARALVIEPEILLLDEPTANLDPPNIEIIEGILKEYNSRKNTTIIIITHNIFQAKRISHHSIFISNGHIVESGPTVKIFNSPSHKETAKFIHGEAIF